MWRAHFTCHLPKKNKERNIPLGQGLLKTIGKEYKDYFSLQFECEDFLIGCFRLRKKFKMF